MVFFYEISKKRLGARRTGFCKRLRVDGGEDAEIMREENGMARFCKEGIDDAMGEEEKMLTEQTKALVGSLGYLGIF